MFLINCPISVTRRYVGVHASEVELDVFLKNIDVYRFKALLPIVLSKIG